MTRLEITLRATAYLEVAAVIGEVCLVLAVGGILWGCVVWHTSVWTSEER